MPSLLVTFALAAHEDIIFVGYIQTRLYGLIKRDSLAILTGAICFSLMHIMVQLGLVGAAAFNIDVLLWLIVLIPMHMVFNALFRRYHSIYPTIIFHAVANGAIRLWARRDTPNGVCC